MRFDKTEKLVGDRGAVYTDEHIAGGRHTGETADVTDVVAVFDERDSGEVEP